MKQKHQYTDQEKIDLFNMMHDSAVTELNESPDNDEHDPEGFWEDTMTVILSLDDNDWHLNQNGHKF